MVEGYSGWHCDCAAAVTVYVAQGLDLPLGTMRGLFEFFLHSFDAYDLFLAID